MDWKKAWLEQHAEMYLKALKSAIEKYNHDCDEYNN